MTASAASTRLGLVVNPSASAGSAAREAAALAAAFAGHGFEVLDLSARSAGTALAHAQQMVAERAIDLLVVAGGDGMAHLGINVCAGHEIPLGIVALGTGNDIATSLGLPIHDPAASVAMIAAGHSRRVDAGRVDGGGHRPWFGGTLYAGFDAIVNERANRMTWPKGQMRYNIATLAELRTFEPLPYTLELDGVTHTLDAMLVAVGNGPSFGGGLRITEGAILDDGLLDVVIIKPMSKMGLVRTYPKLFKGTHVTHPAYEHHRVRTVTVAAPGIVSYADGERFGPLPLTVECAAGALTVLA